MVRGLRRKVRFHKVGVSRSIIIPKDFLTAFPFNEHEAELVVVPEGILIRPIANESTLDEPVFIRFLDFLKQAAVRHPERLGNIIDLTDEDANLVEGIELDDCRDG